LSTDLTNVTIVGMPGATQSVGGILVGPDTFMAGTTHAVHVVDVVTGIITVCVDGPMGGATVNGFQLSNEYRFVISQASAGANLDLLNSGGVPGNWYLNLATTVRGNFPNGWLFGIDIQLADAILELNAGPPFFGVLDAEGAMTYTVPAPLPAGLSLFCVSLEIDPSGPIISVIQPFQYVVQ
jgi:hypothetical protein